MSVILATQEAGSRDQENHGLKLAQAHSSGDSISKTLNTQKRAGGAPACMRP
jgi:hypothetical protein